MKHDKEHFRYLLFYSFD